MNNLGVTIKAARLAAGWKLREVYDKTGLSISYLSDIERGCVNPSFASICRLVEALDIDVLPYTESPLSHEELAVVMAMRNGGALDAIKMVITFEWDGYFKDEGQVE